MRADRHNSSDGLIQTVLNKNYESVSKLCYPIFKKTPINYFDYIRYYDSGDMIVLSTCPDFSTETSIDCLYPNFEELQTFTNFGLKFAFMTYCMPLPPNVDAEKLEKNIVLGLDKRIVHRLYLVERREDHYVTCGFGVTRDIKTIFTFFLNSLTILENFLKYFESSADELLAESSVNERIIMPKYYDKNSVFLNEQETDLFLPSVEFPVKSKKTLTDDNIALTAREIDCLALIAKGFTMKSAARKLVISPRTVEQHLRNIKDKHGVNTKNQLVELWHDSYRHTDGEIGKKE
jgi:DNA-binding CsgD family transcriptional regulator